MPATLTVKETPANDRPRERLLALGPAQLRTAELLAILVRSGRAGESAVQAGERVAAAFSDRIELLTLAGRGELKEISPAIGPAAYCQIMAGIELGRRIAAEQDAQQAPTKISSTDGAKRFCEQRFARLTTDSCREELHIVCLDTKNQVLDSHQISIGTLDASLVHPREVYRPAIKSAAASIIVVHNHPSGDPTPSKADFAVTRRLEEAGRTIGINVLDHIVLGTTDSVSIREFRDRL